MKFPPGFPGSAAMPLAGLSLALTLACAGGGGDPLPPPEPPAIQSFSASPNPVLAGRRTRVTAVFSGSSGSIDQGLGACTSGYPRWVSVRADTAFALTVSNPAGVTVQATTRVQVTQAAGGFRATGNLLASRSNHTATLLADGRVLLLGNGGNWVPSAPEVYDPATGAFQAAGPALAFRGGQAVALLGSGKVLLTGGGSGINVENLELPLASSLIYDPAQASFSGGPALAVARSQHSATPLGDGRVLIAGGLGVQDATAVPLVRAELYDPGDNSFKPTGALVNARWGHQAVRLLDGRVLMVGNGDSRANLGAEIYDPGTGTFSSTGSLTASRQFLSATLLADGRVLILGVTAYSGGSAELFDPATGSFSAAGVLPELSGKHTATLLADGSVLIAGGGPGYFGLDASAYAWLFDPAPRSFRDPGSLQTPRVGHTATRLGNGMVLVAGGTYEAPYPAERYAGPVL